jgi:hypothetical protein
MICGYSENLNKDDLNVVTGLEKELGKTIMAFSCRDMIPEELSNEQFTKIKDAEKRLGVVTAENIS